MAGWRVTSCGSWDPVRVLVANHCFLGGGVCPQRALFAIPHHFSSWVSQRECRLVPEGSLFLFCTKAHNGPKGNYRRWCEGKNACLVLDGMGGGKIGDCWEFSLDNGGALHQESIFLNCPLMRLCPHGLFCVPRYPFILITIWAHIHHTISEYCLAD